MPDPVTPKNPNKIMGLPKWAFWSVIVLVVILAYYLYKRNQNNTQNVATPSATDSVSYIPDTSGLTAADVGGTPSDSGTVYQPGDYTAQFDAIAQQIGQSESDLASQIASISAAGIGTTTASATQPNNPPNVSVTVPIKVVRAGTAKPKAKAKPKPKPKPKPKRRR
jgi:hypothetical protein